MAEKPVVSASKALRDIRSGLSDMEIQQRYSLSEKGFQSLISKLLAMGLITQADLDNRNHKAKSSPGQISAKDFVVQIKAGRTDLDLMGHRYSSIRV